MTEKKVPSIKMPGIEAMSRKIESSGIEIPDKEKLIRYRCAQSLFNISMDLKEIELMGSNVCLIIAKGLIADLQLPESAGSMHSQKTIHDSNVSEEVEAMAEKIKEEIYSGDAPHSFLSKFDDEAISDHG